jgi:hypothetical protein
MSSVVVHLSGLKMPLQQGVGFLCVAFVRYLESPKPTGLRAEHKINLGRQISLPNNEDAYQHQGLAPLVGWLSPGQSKRYPKIGEEGSTGGPISLTDATRFSKPHETVTGAQ